MPTETLVEWSGSTETLLSPAFPSAGQKNETEGTTLHRLRAWGWLSALSLCDQGFTSATGFGVNFLLARWLAPETYGAFAVVFAGFLFVAGFHNVLLLEPLGVIGPSRYERILPEYFRAQVVVHLILVGTFSAIILPATLVFWRVSPTSLLIGPLAGVGIAVPFMLLLWLARRMCYAMRRPDVAAVGGIIYFAIVISGMFTGHFLGASSPVFTFILMGSASLLVACILLSRLLDVTSTPRQTRNALLWQVVLRQNWTYGRWLVGSAILFFVGTQTQMFLVAGLLGLGAAGVLRATQIPSLLMSQIIGSAGLLFLPMFSRDFGHGLIRQMRRRAVLVSLFLGLTAACFAGFLFVLAQPVQHLLYAERYSQHANLIPILALVPVANALMIGCSIALRASHKPYFDLIANAAAAPVAVLATIPLVHRWGLAGATASMALSAFVMSTVIWISFLRQPREAF